MGRSPSPGPDESMEYVSHERPTETVGYDSRPIKDAPAGALTAWMLVGRLGRHSKVHGWKIGVTQSAAISSPLVGIRFHRWLLSALNVFPSAYCEPMVTFATSKAFFPRFSLLVISVSSGLQPTKYT